MGPKSVRLFFPGLLFLLFGLPALADDTISLPGLRVDVFGGWAWGETTESGYLDATPNGEAERGELGVALRHDFSTRLKAVGQIELSQRPGESEAELDFLFLEWRYSDNQTWRFGRSKQPFGIYSEFYDLGTDRPFYDIPQGLYGPTEIVAESLDGISFFTRRDYSLGELSLDVYAGKSRFEPTEPWEFLEEAEEGEEEGEEGFAPSEDVDRNETVGIRLQFQTRFGLTAGFSTFRGKDTHSGDADFGVAYAMGAHIMWDNGVWLLRAEAVRFEEDGNLDIDTAYIEAARRLGPWQLALRWDRAITTVDEFDLESEGVSSLGEHRDLAAGLNYWVRSNLVLKLSHHRVEGGRFLALSADGLNEEEIGLWRFGVQFVY